MQVNQLIVRLYEVKDRRDDCRHLNNNAEYVEKYEVPVSGFVSEKEHSQSTARASSQKRECDESALRNTPPAFFCSMLVYSIENEGYEGNYCKCRN